MPFRAALILRRWRAVSSLFSSRSTAPRASRSLGAMLAWLLVSVLDGVDAL
jgi:hypothetical protein